MGPDVKERLEILIAREGLGDWDTNFIHSLQEQLEKRGRLSERQLEVLTKIEDRYTADAIMSRIKWEEGYDEEKRNITRVCAIYYATTGYFRDLVNKALYEESFIPTEKQWNSMCCNKYAMKVREAYSGEAKFPVGTMIAVRKTTPGAGPVLARYSQKVGTDLAIILSDSEPVVSASRGNRRYRIHFVGDSTPQFAEERDIKKLPKKYQKK